MLAQAPQRFLLNLTHALARQAKLLGQRLERAHLAAIQTVTLLNDMALPFTEHMQTVSHQGFDLLPFEAAFRIAGRRIIRDELDHAVAGIDIERRIE